MTFFVAVLGGLVGGWLYERWHLQGVGPTVVRPSSTIEITNVEGPADVWVIPFDVRTATVMSSWRGIPDA